MRKEIEETIYKGSYGMDDDEKFFMIKPEEIIDQICSLMIERLEKIRGCYIYKKRSDEFAKGYDKCVNDVDERVENLIKELKGKEGEG